MNHSGASSLLPPRSCSHLHLCPRPLTFWFPSGYPQPQPQPPVRCSISRFLLHPNIHQPRNTSPPATAPKPSLVSYGPPTPYSLFWKVGKFHRVRLQGTKPACSALSSSSQSLPLLGLTIPEIRVRKKQHTPHVPLHTYTQTVYVLLILKVIDLITFGNFLFYFCSFYVLLGGNRVRKKRKPCQD